MSTPMAHRHNRFNSYNFLQRSTDRTTENNQNAWIAISTVTRSEEKMKKRPPPKVVIQQFIFTIT